MSEPIKIEDMIHSDTLILKKDWEKKLGNLMKDKEVTSRIAFLPVRPDWNEPRKMWGYYNPLTGLFYPTDGLRVLLNAYREFVKDHNKDKKHFIILDEMNLARVEYYMSDLLSLMENMCSVRDGNLTIGEMAMVHPLSRCVLSKLPDNDKIENDREKSIKEWEKYIKEEDGEIRWKIEGEKMCFEICKECPYYALKENKKEQKQTQKMENFISAFNPIPPRIAYPENLVIIGTVNVDETTFSFAPKVLDRAFVCEFNEVHVEEYFQEYSISDNNDFKTFIETLNGILKPATLHFGYRVIKEMWDYLKTSEVNNNSLDFLLKSKVLPKIHGTEEQVGKVLKRLFIYCEKDTEKDEDIEEKLKKIAGENNLWEDSDTSQFRFKDSARKIQEMYKRMKALGYASFF